MPKAICALSLLKCSCGTVPTPFIVLPINGVTTTGLPAGNALDNIPFLNIIPFGMCTTSANPTVAAAGGSPMPCIPVTLFPWSDTATTVKIKGIPSVTQESKLQCLWTGSISVEAPSQFVVDKE